MNLAPRTAMVLALVTIAVLGSTPSYAVVTAPAVTAPVVTAHGSDRDDGFFDWLEEFWFGDDDDDGWFSR